MTRVKQKEARHEIFADNMTLIGPLNFLLHKGLF